jgi:branched-chain amino acid transport system permease protein
VLGIDFGNPSTVLGLVFSSTIKYYYFLLGGSDCRDHREPAAAGFAHRTGVGGDREDELAARSMGINTRNMKLLAFAMGASFGGVAAACSPAIQGFISPESFILVESVMVLSMIVLGGMGNIWGVILGAFLLSFVPEILRYTVEPVQHWISGRSIIDPEGDPHAALRARDGRDDALPSLRGSCPRRCASAS